MTDKTYNTIWISDVHLGNPNSQYEKLYKFLKSLETSDGYRVKNLYLVGDIIDMTQFNHKVFWGYHRIVIKKLFRMADKGVNIVYIRGNHDYFIQNEFLKDNPQGICFNQIKIKYNDTYTALDGKTYFVLHGDEFDGVVRTYPILYWVGDKGYKIIITLNTLQNKLRRLLKIKEWSFAQWVKVNVKRSVQFINNFETLVVGEAQKRGVDGVICGHIHSAEDSLMDGVRYLNCGCWVEFCSYISEDENGKIEVNYYE